MTTLEILVSLSAIFGIPIGFATVFYTARESARDARRDELERKRAEEADRKAEIEAAVKAQQEDDAREINRIRDDLIEMTKDRDDWRTHARQLEANR